MFIGSSLVANVHFLSDIYFVFTILIVGRKGGSDV